MMFLSSVLIVFTLLSSIYCQHAHNSTADLYDRAISDVWSSSDYDDDGVFSRAELARVFKHYDTNHDGKVNRHEYVNFVIKPNPQLAEYSHFLFNNYDANKDHHIDDNDLDMLLMKMDQDHNGVVSKADFYAYWHLLLKASAHLHGHGAHLQG